MTISSHPQQVCSAALLAGLVSLCAGSLATAAPTTTQTLDLSVTSPASTTDHPKSAQLKVAATTTEPDGAQPPTADEVVLRLSKGLRFNGGRFPVCDARLLQRSGGPGCSSASQVGTGSVVASAGDITVKPAVKVFAAGPSKLVLFVTLDRPVSLHYPVVATIQRQPGPRSLVLRVPMPAVLKEPVAGLKAAIRSLSFIIRATRTVHGKRVGIIESVGCPRGGYQADVAVLFDDGQSASADSTSPCR